MPQVQAIVRLSISTDPATLSTNGAILTKKADRRLAKGEPQAGSLNG
jgi:hypothetical protein